MNESEEPTIAESNLRKRPSQESNSRPDDDNEPKWMATQLLPLLREYTEKLARASEKIVESQVKHLEARSVKDRTFAERYRREFELAKEYYLKLVHPAEDLARQVSQLTTHGRLPTASRLELSLRLAEFEAALDQARRRVKTGLNG